MANAAGMLKESIWRDADWRRLPRAAQATYAQLLSQKELDRAGMLPLQVSKWAKGCDEISDDAIWHDLKLLEDRRFIVIDEDTDELFIRSYMRHSEVTKYPQFIKASVRCARLVASPRIRREMARELRRLGVSDALKAADEIDPPGTLREPFGNPSSKVPEPFENPSTTVKGSGTVPERCVVGEGVGEVLTVGGYLGGSRAREDEPAPEQVPESVNDPPPPNNLDDEQQPPPPFCDKHMPQGTDEPCRACAARRTAHTDWLAERSRIASEAAYQHARAQRATATNVRLQAIDNCGLCDEDGYRPNFTVCDHIDRSATAANGSAAVREALAENKARKAHRE